ncbi:MAG TPA: TOMM precursor leader peptide-binding protein [Actinophytocola sp.]|jgi:ribosomal protein S12 methylthiotransferase accessory factor|uniref:TOMM precursor leader peptide-binding protein n=1 Tax=Actinophytocola sp. TaxID=1872138 RepID=UPI002E0C4DA9|nr:TOMM precursor leader peptide-binding protein [Actinophytocola sp.]
MRSVADTAQLVGFKRHLRAEVAAGEGAYLFSERGVTRLTGSRIEVLASLLDGTRNLATVLEAMPDGMAPEQVAGLIARLAEAGLVTLRTLPPVPIDERTLAYWDASGVDATAAVAGTAARTLRLITVGDVDEAAALSALRSAQLRTEPAGPSLDPGEADLSVVLCEDYLDPRLAQVDADHRALGRPWLLAKPVGAKIWIGPVFQPAEPGCWRCLAVRLWGNRNAEKCAQSALGRHGPAPRPAASLPPLTATALHLITLEATKWLAGYRYAGQREVWTLDSFDLRGEHHAMRALPQCPACGHPALMRQQGNRPVVLASRCKASYSGGGHRSHSPDQVLDRFRHLISPVTGIVKEIQRDERGPAIFNSFRSGANVAARVDRVDTLRAALRTQNGGKGITEVHARASALCEAIERHSGNFHGDEARVRASLRSLGDRAVAPNDYQLYHERQYANRAAWNAAHAPFQYVCEPFDDTAIVDWTPVWSMTEQRHRLLPTGLLYFGAPPTPGHDYLFADSNGNAAGSSLEDAVLQGSLELIERDAVALWWYNRTRAPEVDLDAFRDPWVDELREAYAGLGREVWVLDVTSDLDVPVMVAMSRLTDREPENIMLGFGAHLDARVALRRALTELNQMMPQALATGPDGRIPTDDPDAARWWWHATIANQPYLVPDPGQRRRGPQDYNYTPSRDLLEDVAAVQAGFETRGMELLVLDQTRPDVGLPVAKVIVPGMRHFWARLGPGRLYDVPVALGRLIRPTGYEELNPIPMFL